MDLGHVHFRASDGAEASVYWGKRQPEARHEYYVTTYWPAGVQDFPDCDNFDELAEIPRRIEAAQSRVESRGFIPFESTV